MCSNFKVTKIAPQWLLDIVFEKPEYKYLKDRCDKINNFYYLNISYLTEIKRTVDGLCHFAYNEGFEFKFTNSNKCKDQHITLPTFHIATQLATMCNYTRIETKERVNEHRDDIIDTNCYNKDGWSGWESDGYPREEK